jgi:methyl-accepting chemotaxis protein
MNEQSLSKLKNVLTVFDDLTNGVKDLITELEKNDVGAEFIEETLEAMDEVENSLTSALDNAEEAVNAADNARSNIDSALDDLRTLMRKLKTKEQ